MPGLEARHRGRPADRGGESRKPGRALRINVVRTMDPVLVAVDPTGPADAQEQLGLVLARATGAEIVLATVFPMIHLRSYVHSRSYETRLRQEAERFLAGRAEAPRRRVPELTIETKTTGAASAAHGLHRLARELDASVVVLGPSRRRGRGVSVPGPMGSRFAHGAPCPVAVAPAEGPIRRRSVSARR